MRKHGLPVLQPSSLKEAKIVDVLIQYSPDLAVVVAYGKIIPPSVLRIPKYGMLNIHPSLLPQYRGPSPVASAIMHGETNTGVSIMLLDSEMDHGPLLTQASLHIPPDAMLEDMHTQLFTLGASILPRTLFKYLSGDLKPQEQDHTQATYCTMLKREDGMIHVSKTAHEVYNQYRGLTPWPGVYFFWNKKRIKILQACAVGAQALHELRRSFNTPQNSDDNLFVSSHKLYMMMCDAPLQLLVVQPEGKKALSAIEFIAGYMK